MFPYTKIMHFLNCLGMKIQEWDLTCYKSLFMSTWQVAYKISLVLSLPALFGI